MFQTLSQDILPVFAILAVGFAMGRGKIVAHEEARSLNRIAFLVLQPPLIFLLLTGIDTSAIEYGAIGIYALCEIVVFWITFMVARMVFGKGPRESALLGMTVIFVNSLLYMWPVTSLIYGESATVPISIVVALDTMITFAIFIILMELTSGGDISHGLRRLAVNPVILTVIVATTLNLLSVTIPEPVQTAARFVGGATAPVTLFALGVVLSTHPIMPGVATATISVMKLALMPFAVWLGFVTLSPDNGWGDLFILNAAGPSGAMAFSLAMLYNVRTDTIAPVIIWTSFLSLFSLAYLA